MSTYQAALDVLNRFINYEQSMPSIYSPETLNLDRVNLLLDRLARPDRSFRSIHIAGTKGKGSTAAMIESILRAAGYRTGLYTSPHLHTFRERIRIGGEIISRDDFVRAFEAAHTHATEINGLTWFEFMTAIAFQAFAQAKIEVGVIEVGLGGRFDATNVITPLVSVITSLSMDHMKLLGNTLEQIAFEKSGIIKPNVPVVSSPQKAEALAVVETTAKERNAPLIVVGREVTYQILATSIDGQEFEIWNADFSRQVEPTEVGVPFSIPLLGAHQVTNAATAIAAVQVAHEHGLPITTESIKSGLANVKWPGRLEILNRDPLIVVDGAHNADSAQKLSQSLHDIFGDRPWTLIIGISADKDIPAILGALLPIASRTIVTRAHNARAADIESLAEKVSQHGATPAIAASVSEALETAIPYGHSIIVTGSLFTVAEARAMWLKRSGIELMSDE